LIVKERRTNFDGIGTSIESVSDIATNRKLNIKQKMNKNDYQITKSVQEKTYYVRFIFSKGHIYSISRQKGLILKRIRYIVFLLICLHFYFHIPFCQIILGMFDVPPVTIHTIWQYFVFDRLAVSYVFLLNCKGFVSADALLLDVGNTIWMEIVKVQIFDT
jgi:hypothetical protein